MNFISLLPRDTRTAELASAGALILSSLLFFVGFGAEGRVADLKGTEFWVIITLCFGILQILAILEEHLEHLRAIVAWIAGSFWIWSALDTLTFQVQSTEVAAFMLGITNFYAFVINAMMVKNQLWK
jgi:multisubunit Na+/H+ antiporter MnhB subunit